MAARGPPNSLAVGVAAGAVTLAACGVGQSVHLTVAALHLGLCVLLRLGSHRADLFRGLCSHRGEELLGGSPRGEKLLVTPLLGVGCSTLGPGLGLCSDPPGLLLCFAHDVRCRGARLVEDCGSFRLNRGAQLCGLFVCLSEHHVGLRAALRGGDRGLLGSPLCSLDISVASQPGTVNGRVRLDAFTFEQPLLLLPVRHFALAGMQLFLELAGALACATLTEPLTHELQVAVDLDRVITAPDKSKVALYDVHRTRLTLTARGHGLLRSPVHDRLLQPRS
jgi:hypothetical protein